MFVDTTDIRGIVLGMNNTNTKTTLTENQIKTIRSEWEKVSRIDPASIGYHKLINFLDSLDQATLKNLVSAKIKFVSSLAMNRVK